MKTTEKYLYHLGVFILALLCCFDTAHAQNNTLSASPQQLTFNTQPGVATTPQTVLITSSTGPTNVNVAASSTNNWLMVTPTSGTTPLSLTVSIGPTAPTSGTDVGFINVSAPNAFLSVAVVLNATSGTPSALSANPNSLSFTFAANSTVPSTQQLSITSNNANVSAFTASAITSNGGNWLTVSPPSGSLPATVQVTVNPVALQGQGPFSGSIAINSPGTTGISVPVLVTLAGTPALNVSPSSISLAYQIGTPAPPAQNLSITSSTGANVAFTATTKTANCGTGWIVLSQQSGATPSSLTVQINVSSLTTAATCNGEVDIAAPSASNPNVVVPVTVLVTANPLILVPSTGPTFNYQLGSSTVPAPQNVQITSSSTPLNFTAAATPVNQGPNFLVVTPTSGTTPAPISLSLNPSVLPTIGPGTYTETVTVTSAGAGNSPQSFPVTLVVSSSAVLTSNVPSLNFNAQIGQAQPPNQTITINSTGAPLNFQVAANTTSCNGFLSATPTTGLTFGGQNQVVVSVNTAGITPQACSGNITITVPGSTAPPLVIPVSLNVSNTPLLNVSQNAINLTVLAGAPPVTQQVSVTSTDPNTAITFSATAATNPIGLTWLAVAPNSGNTPNNLAVTINPANLAVGTYTGTITVSAPNIPSQTIAVTLVVASSTVTATPATLTFTQPLGGAAPPSQTVQIGGVAAGTTLGAVTTLFNGTGWLNATVAGSTVTVTANGSQLQQGTYTGVVTVIVPGASNSPLYIPVTLTVGAPLALNLSTGTVNFTYQAASPTLPQAQTVQVTTNGGSVPFNVSFTPNKGGNFLTVSPVSGNTPATLNLTLNGAVLSTLAAGTYTGTVTVSSPNIATGQTINVTLTVTPQAPPVISAVTSAASLQPGPISPGEVVSLFGGAIGPASPASGLIFTPTPNNTVATTLGNVTVTFNNVPAPLLFVSATQINAIVPYEIAGQLTANVVVQFGSAVSAVFQVRVVDTTPAIFTLTQNGSGQGAILNQNLSVNGTANPAPKGSVVVIYATGEGQLVPRVVTGSITPGTAPIPKPVANVSLTIGGQPATVLYAGEAPLLVSGVLQVNAVLPDNIASGNQPIVLTVGTNTNAGQNVTVAVQ